jgi:thioredoxin reductase (NADPH)
VSAPISTDAVVIGAGPVGLFQVFELGLLDIKCHVIDSLPFTGGQCVELYADKPIYDIPATPVCTGRELVTRLLKQVEPFNPTWHLGQQVDTLQREADGRFLLSTSSGVLLLTKTVFIAAGVGSFQPRRLKIDELKAFEGTQVFYSQPNAQTLAGQRVVVVGDGQAALECAAWLAQDGQSRAASVTLMHRRDEFKASRQTIDEIQQLRASQRLRFIAAQATGAEVVRDLELSQDRLNALQVTTSDGTTHSVPLDILLVLTGLSPKLGPIANWGLALERKQLVVDTEKFQTAVSGIHAVGDINTYPGKKKLILCGFHEAALAAFGAASYMRGGGPVHLEYTTTSPRLHRVLGVAPQTER